MNCLRLARQHNRIKPSLILHSINALLQGRDQDVKGVTVCIRGNLRRGISFGRRWIWSSI